MNTFTIFVALYPDLKLQHDGEIQHYVQKGRDAKYPFSIQTLAYFHIF